jgi:hypothetical protein
VIVVEHDADGATLSLSREELGTLSSALNEILHGPTAIEDWEFQTRIGVGREAATRLVHEINALLR